MEDAWPRGVLGSGVGAETLGELMVPGGSWGVLVLPRGVGVPGGLGFSWGCLCSPEVSGGPRGVWVPGGGVWGSLTLLKGCVLHAVGAIAKVGDEGVDGGP